MATVSPELPSPAPFDLDKELCELALATAPRFFAVALTYEWDTEEADAVIAAWGITYDDGRTEVISIRSSRRWVLASPGRALRWFTHDGATPRLVWLTPPVTATLNPGVAA